MNIIMIRRLRNLLLYLHGVTHLLLLLLLLLLVLLLASTHDHISAFNLDMLTPNQMHYAVSGVSEKRVPK